MYVSELKTQLDKYDDEDEVILTEGDSDFKIDSISSDGVSKVMILIGDEIADA